MNKHTPGSWKKVNAIIDNEPNQYMVQEDKWGGKNICNCGPSSGEDWDVNEANARLISAAPDLLEALKDCVSQVKFGAIWDKDGKNVEWFKRSKEAIAKAEGKE